MILLPPPTEPVKQTFAMSVFRISADMLASLPVTTLSTPGGSFSAIRCTTRVVASGADNGGLTIAVLPASSACGSDAPRIAIGQLKGTMMVTTPSGWYDTVVSTGMAPGTAGSILPCRPRRRASGRGSSGSRTRVNRPTPRSGSCRSPATGSPHRRRVRAVDALQSGQHLLGALGGVSAAQAGYAAFAAATASRTSSGVADAA